MKNLPALVRFVGTYAALALLLGLARPASAATVHISGNGGAPITINDNSNASPYPSNATVSGVSVNTLTKVQVILSNFSHTYPADVDVLLVGPQGQRCMLMSDAGGINPVSNVNLTFSSTAATVLPTTAPATGTYRPANYPNDQNPSDLTDTFPSPGPGTLNAQPADLTVFNLTNPNGTWSLYVVDDTLGDAGSISGGWVLLVTVPTVLTVTNTSDAGPGSLRDTLAAAGNDDLINFSSLFNTPQTINLLTALPDITKSVTIQGPGANLLTVRRDFNAATNFSIFNIAGAVANGVAISGMTVTGGNAGNFGGGIDSSSNLTLTNVHATGNQASFGGGLSLRSADGVFINCTFSGNKASGQGGGIDYQGNNHTLRLVNSTVSGNTTGGNGGAIFNFTNFPDGNRISSLVVVNSTIANNTGGGIRTFTQNNPSNTSTTTLRNTIIAGNTPDNLATQTVGGGAATFQTLGFNLSDNFNGVFTPIPGSDITAQPRLAPLALYGGQTPTLALLGDSPAIDAGDSSGFATDQRGRTRPSNTFGIPNVSDGADIGAAEMQIFPVTNTSNTGAGSLRDAVTNAPPDSDILFAVPLFNSPQTIMLTTGEVVINKNLNIIGTGANLLTVSGNNASRVFNIPGGGLNVAFSGLTISNGLVNQSGGGIQSFSNLVLTNVYVTANQITGIGSGGGGVSLDGADGVFTSCTFSGNTAGGSFPFGGGIRFNGSPSHRLRLVSSTVSGNSVTGGDGGGIYHISASGGSRLEVVNTTIANNSAGNGGGAYMFVNPMTLASSTTTLRNSIIANNTANNLERSGNLAFIISQGFNLANDNGGGFLNVAPITSDKINANAGLGPLASNGGPTPTHALMFNSAALDAGNNSGSGTLFDQRGPGFPRTTDYSNIPNASGGDGTDIGAVEGTALTITAISHQTNGHTLLQGFGAPNLTYTVEASPDLSPGSFVALPTTVTADGTGALQYDDATAVGLTKRFYRLRFP